MQKLLAILLVFAVKGFCQTPIPKSNGDCGGELQTVFEFFIKNGDLRFVQKSFYVAKIHYNEALAVKPPEQYPKDMIIKCNAIIKRDSLKEIPDSMAAEFNRIADWFFNKDSYEKAEQYYLNSLSYNPKQYHPNDRIAQCEQRIQAENLFKEHIALGDKFFNEKKYAEAKTEYHNALSWKSGSPYPLNKIAIIDKILKNNDK